jgi:L-asparaginase II
MINPVIAEVTRGGIVESRHRGAVAVVDGTGRTVLALGDVKAAVFPRSAIKAFQCLPVIDSGAADRFGFTDEDIALCCSSHNGEAEHVRVARAMLNKCGASEAHYECGAHWPLNEAAHHALVRQAPEPAQVHNNCSGKHAGMLALARQLGADPLGYVQRDHPVQRAIAAAMGKICDIDLDAAPCGVDGCSVPTWAMPLSSMALGFARLAAPDNSAGSRIIAAVRAHPFMVAGSGRFDTEVMQAVPRLFCKVGAEGVYGAAIPHAGLGVALKVDDGQGRGAEVALAETLLKLDCWTADERRLLTGFSHHPLANWRKIAVGEVRGVAASP